MTTLTIKTLVFALWVYAWAFIAPVSHFLLFTVALVLCDLYTGVLAAKKRGEALRSRGFYRSVQKITLYYVAILLSHGMKHVFFVGLDFDIVWMVAGIISLTEFKSNLENVATVTGTDIWTLIANYIPRLPKLPK
jgi:phage-related holin